MVKRALVVDLHPSSVCLAVASHEAACHLIADFAGRVVHPLSAPQLWSAATTGDDAKPAVPLPDCVLPDCVQLVQSLILQRDEPLENTFTVRSAVTALLRGLKAFAESRLEADLMDLAVALPQSFSHASRELVQSCAFDVGFANYKHVRQSVAAMIAYRIEESTMELNVLVVDVDATGVEAILYSVEEGVFDIRNTSRRIQGHSRDLAVSVLEAVACVLEQAQVASDQIDHVLFMGDAIDTEEALAIFDDSLDERLPLATFHNTIEPREACAYGLIDFMRTTMAPSDPSQLFICLTPVELDVAIEASDGVSAQLVARNTMLPTNKTTRIRVFSDQEDGTVHLRFCEGQRPDFQDNVFLGALPINGLRAGWNELQVRVDVTVDYSFQINVAAVFVLDGNLTPCGQLAISSAVVNMTANDITGYFDELERMPTNAERIERHQRVEQRNCTEALVAAACGLVPHARTNPLALQHGDVRVVKFQTSNSTIADLEAENAPTTELLDRLGQLNAQDHTLDAERQLHDTALALLGDRIQWRTRSLSDRCWHCVAFLNTTSPDEQ